MLANPIAMMVVMMFITYSKGKSIVPEGIPGWLAQLCPLVSSIWIQLLCNIKLHDDTTGVELSG